MAVLSFAACGETPTGPAPASSPDAETVDVDLTLLEPADVYAEVWEMLGDPSIYAGKTVKLAGEYLCMDVPETGMKYHICIVYDGNGQSQGVEFILADGSRYPDDGDPITVSGVMELYSEGEDNYCHLINAIIHN